jgi:cysteine desulfurase/selenocysteine lyase
MSAAARGEVESRTSDIAALRADFPVLAQQVRGQPLTYLDNAASSQML